MAPGLVLGTELYRRLTPAAKRSLEHFGSRSVAGGPTQLPGWPAARSSTTGGFFERRKEIRASSVIRLPKSASGDAVSSC
jgi:hypothetical protein